MSAAIDGVLVVDKPPGPTSHDVVAVARRALGTSRVGHTGTLDPMATGVLALVVGRATRLARYMAGDVKAYEAIVTFGRATDTYDAQGATVRDTGLHPEREALAHALTAFTGRFLQTPPAYSAKKIAGEAAYRYARRAAPVVPDPVEVAVHELALTAYDQGTAALTLRVSAGFYVRSLAFDLGERLGTGAHLSALRRTRSGAFTLAQALSWDALARGGPDARAALAPIDSLLPGLPAVVLAADDAVRVRHGQTVKVAAAATAPGATVRLFDQAGHLLGVAYAGPADAGSAAGVAPSRTVLQPVVILG